MIHELLQHNTSLWVATLEDVLDLASCTCYSCCFVVPVRLHSSVSCISYRVTFTVHMRCMTRVQSTCALLGILPLSSTKPY